ncbi:MAG: hypothetical protein J1F36_02115 [Clostridiales bacterium]|nr:hypothetical protein [Clostridiales bacterium]
MEKTSKQYFTRKNFIVFSVVALFAILLVLVALCLDHSDTAILSTKNPIAKIADGFRFEHIAAHVQGIIGVALIAVYAVIFTVAFVFEKRLAYVNGKPQWSTKMIFIYVGTLFACIILSLGLGIVIQPQLSGENIRNFMVFLGESITIAIVLYILLGAIVVAVSMLVINFLKVGKPFEFFDSEPLDEIIEEEEPAPVSANFDESEPHPFEGFAGGAGEGVVGGGVGVGGSAVAGAVELDTREKVFPALSAIDSKYDGFTADKIISANVSLKQLCEGFRNYLARYEKLYFDIETIRMFISGLNATRLIVLEGLSGTGKTSLPRYFTKYIGGSATFLAVQATWRDRTNLLGYFNDFSKTYNETDFLSALYEANYDEDRISMFVLDEFNISRVEYYFADFLSVLEFPPEAWNLRVMQLPMGFVPPVKLEQGNIHIPQNCYFIATANKDDSTFAIADKVYDRAITIEFENRNLPFEPTEDCAPIAMGMEKLQQLFNEAVANSANAFTSDDFNKFSKVTGYIYDTFDVAVGNRVLNQISIMVPTYVACGGSKEEVLDFILARKVISKLEGRFEDYLKDGLKQLMSVLENVYGAGTFARSEKAIQNLLKKL